MEIFVAADIFRSPIRTLFQDLERVVVYIDDIMIINSSTIEDQLQDVNEVLSRLYTKGLRVNYRKAFFPVQEVEYMGFILTRKRINPQLKKGQGVVDLEPLPLQQKYDF